MENNHIKNAVIHSLSYYSKYYCRLFIECENLYENEKGHFALFNLLALFENIAKSVLNDFESNFQTINLKLREQNLINEIELDFLNNSKKGIRKIRNILAHANLSKYDLKINSNDTTYPFTENETCLILYKDISIVISFFILKILSSSTIDSECVNADDAIKSLDFSFVIRTPKELVNFKGLELDSEFDNLDEASQYRLIENSSDVNILASILKNLKL